MPLLGHSEPPWDWERFYKVQKPLRTPLPNPGEKSLNPLPQEPLVVLWGDHIPKVHWGRRWKWLVALFLVSPSLNAPISFYSGNKDPSLTLLWRTSSEISKTVKDSMCPSHHHLFFKLRKEITRVTTCCPWMPVSCSVLCTWHVFHLITHPVWWVLFLFPYSSLRV
jgi:hypothetical protein